MKKYIIIVITPTENIKKIVSADYYVDADGTYCFYNYQIGKESPSFNDEFVARFPINYSIIEEIIKS